MNEGKDQQTINEIGKNLAGGCQGCTLMIIGIIGLILAYLFYAFFIYPSTKK